MLRNARPAPARGTGCPEPPTIGSGPAITTAPVGGSRARFRSWVRPYLPAPSRNEWQGNGGSNECAAPGVGADGLHARARSPATPRPAISRTRREMPGVCGPVSFALRNSAWSPDRASQPVRYSSQPPSGSGPCSASHCLTCSISSRKSGSAAASALKSSTTAGAISRARRDLRHVLAVLAGDPVHRGVEVGAGVLAGADVVPVPGRAAVVVAADLRQLEAAPCCRTARAAAGSASRRTAAR